MQLKIRKGKRHREKHVRVWKAIKNIQRPEQMHIVVETTVQELGVKKLHEGMA